MANVVLRDKDRHSDPFPSDAGETGDTLVEVLIALLVISLCGVALLTAFSTSITASGTYQNLAGGDVILRSAGEAAYAAIQQSQTPLYSACTTSYPGVVFPTWSGGFSATVSSVVPWGNSGPITGTCSPSAVLFQVVTVSVSTPQHQTLSTTLTVDGQ